MGNTGVKTKIRTPEKTNDMGEKNPAAMAPERGNNSRQERRRS